MIRKNDMQLRFAECRSLGHEWRKQPIIGIDDTSDTFRRPFGMSTGMIGIPSICGNCTKEKVRWITRSGESFTRYNDPDGYARHGDDVRTAQEWRSEYVEVIFSQFEESITKPKRTGSKRA